MSRDPRVELERLATVAHEQGRVKVEAVCRLALARLAELEGELLHAKASRTLANHARAETLGPARRKEIATAAANARWLRRRAS